MKKRWHCTRRFCYVRFLISMTDDEEVALYELCSRKRLKGSSSGTGTQVDRWVGHSQSGCVHMIPRKVVTHELIAFYEQASSRNA